jgi:hypothetical protein
MDMRWFIEIGMLRIVADYFADVLVYNDKFFRRRFRMSRNLFCGLLKVLKLTMTILGKGQILQAYLVPWHCRKWLAQSVCKHMMYQPIQWMR